MASAHFVGIEEWLDLNLSERDKEWLAADPERKVVVYVWEALVVCYYISARGVEVEWEEVGHAYTFMPDEMEAYTQMMAEYSELCEWKLEIENLYLQSVELVNPYAV